jgi:hypothetical protein
VTITASALAGKLQPAFCHLDFKQWLEEAADKASRATTMEEFFSRL